jgi:murein tripeptide amidase MpaA
MKLFGKFSASLRLGGLIILLSFAIVAQVPSPTSVLGFTPTDDKTIADWTQITNYLSRLDSASNRVAVREIGKTTLGKPLIVAFISAPDNIKNLDRYRRISAKLADPRTIRDAKELEDLIREGKSVVSISCSIHSTEIVASQMSMNLAYNLATANDDDTKEILNNTILLLIPSLNPDGIDIVANWYRKTLGLRPRERRRPSSIITTPDTTTTATGSC